MTGDSCEICNLVVGNDDYGIACEICECWFHIKCEGMTEDEYSFLDAHKSLHWYCAACNKSVASTIKLFQSLKQKVDGMEIKLDKICDGILPEGLSKVIDSKMNDVASKLDLKINGLLLDFQQIKDQVASSELKLETAIEAKLVDSVGTLKKDLEPSWATI